LGKITLRRASWFVPLTKYYSGDDIKVDEMGEGCGTYGGDKNAYRVVLGKLERKRPF
jgi:hypothetical protein